MYETVCIEITVVVVWSLLFVLSNFSRTHRILLQLDEWYNIATQSYQASVDSQTSKQVDAIFFIFIFYKILSTIYFTWSRNFEYFDWDREFVQINIKFWLFFSFVFSSWFPFDWDRLVKYVNTKTFKSHFSEKIVCN